MLGVGAAVEHMQHEALIEGEEDAMTNAVRSLAKVLWFHSARANTEAGFAKMKGRSRAEVGHPRSVWGVLGNIVVLWAISFSAPSPANRHHEQALFYPTAARCPSTGVHGAPAVGSVCIASVGTHAWSCMAHVAVCDGLLCSLYSLTRLVTVLRRSRFVQDEAFKLCVGR